MFSITGTPTLDALIVCAGVFGLLQLGTMIYKKYVKKDNVMVSGGDLGRTENISNNK